MGKNAHAGKRSKEVKPFPEYFVFSEVERFSLILCVVLDISEYVATVLTMPIIGDMLDVVGIIACLVIFRWIGLVSIFELVPGADILPIFIITWLVWYFLKKHEREEHKSLQKKWLQNGSSTAHRCAREKEGLRYFRKTFQFQSSNSGSRVRDVSRL